MGFVPHEMNPSALFGYARSIGKLSTDSIARAFAAIIDFTELGQFIDMPFRTYSAGMRARLDFAISTSIEAEILLLDEGLGAGDASFTEKAGQRLQSMAGTADIVVLASHSEYLLRSVCTHAALMEAGRILAVGPIDDILKQYRASLAAA